MSVSAVAPTPFYQDPDRLQIGLPQASSEDKAAATGKDGDRHLSMFAAGDDEPSFWDLLDVINPLQHIPVVSNLYREMTGDQIGVGARLAGGALFGGALGLIASAVDCVVEESTGADTGGHMLALFRDEGDSAPTTATQFAQPQSQPDQKQPAAAEAAPASPAKTVTAERSAAPVITLPAAGPAGGAQPMVFSLDGMQAAPAASQPAPQGPLQTLAGVTPAAAKPADAAAARPMPLVAGLGRTMPVPARNPNATAAVQPPVTVPISTSSTRSNTPITGRSPTAAAGVAAAQRAQVSQEKLGNHPMLPPTDANGQTAAGPDWFTSAWGQALDKYQRSNQRNEKAGTAANSTLE